MKKILLLGGSAQQVIAIETAKRLGYYTVLCDYLEDNPGQYCADRFYLVSTTDKDAVLAVAKNEQVSGVLAYASDPAAPTAAYVAKKMCLPGNPYLATEVLCNKDKFRSFLRDNGFCAPSSFSYVSTEDAIADSSRFHYPLIIKPVDSSGSKGATVLNSPDGIRETLEFAFSFSRSHRVIVEDYVERFHPYLIGGDIFVVDGKIAVWGLLNCHRDSKVNPLVPVGKSYPLALGDEDQAIVRETLQTLVTRLGIQNGAMNVELVIDQKKRVWLIDVGPRSGGNMIPDLLGDIFDINIPEMTIHAAMGQPIHVSPKENHGYYATHNLHTANSGIYKKISFSDELDQYIYRKCLYKKQGDLVEYFDNASKCLGVIFMRFENQKQMESCLGKINELYSVEFMG